MSAPDRHGADRFGADRYGADRYGPGRFPGTHVHDAHEGGGAVQAGGVPGSPNGGGDGEAVWAGAPLGESVPAGMRAVLAARAAGRAEEDAAIAAAVADVRAAAAAERDPAATPATDRDARGHLWRQDGWTGERQRDFLAAIAEGHTVEQACRIVGLSVASAYALRRRAGGAAFALGWRAATLLAREHVADTLLARAIEGQTETVTRANGDVIERHRYDNRLAMSLLARLDRQAEAPAPGGHLAAQMVAGEFDAFLDLVGRDGGPARAGLFLALRTEAGVGSEADTPGTLADLHTLARADRFVRTGAGTAAEVDIADLDPAHRGHWTAEQWARAEAAGLVTLAPPPPEPAPAPGPEAGADCAVSPQLPQLHLDAVTIGEAPEEAPVWWDEPTRAYRTTLAPPPGFDGDEDGAFGDDDYSRSLDADEAAIAARLHAAERADRLAMERAGRDDWFATADGLAALPVWAPDEHRLAA